MRKAKGTVFVEHIRKHLDHMNKRFGFETKREVICKICDMTVDEIYEEYKNTIAKRRLRLAEGCSEKA